MAQNDPFVKIVQFTIYNSCYMLGTGGNETAAELCMLHRGIEYTMALAAPGVWKWQFRIRDQVKSGITTTKLRQLAIRRVEQRIDRELKKAADTPRE